METSHLLATMRRDAHLSQAALARRSGIPRTVINAYESGRRQPGAHAVARLAEACGMRVVVQPRPALDERRIARELEQVLDLSDSLPKRRRPSRLEFPPLPQRTSRANLS